MDTFIIKGGKPLYGSVRLGGAKNASFKLMIAAFLSSEGESRLLNFSHINDVEITRQILEDLGATTRNAGERTMFISCTSVQNDTVPQKYGAVSRASTLFLGPLLARFGHAVVPLPGGDAIGKRPIDRHILGLEALGAKITHHGDRLEASVEGGLKGANYTFDRNTHTGTETLLLAAVLAKGTTILQNTALEPEIDDLIDFLNEMGAKIRRRANRVIEIDGVEKLHPAIHKIMPDRNEAVSYACAAIATKGDIIVENAKQEHLQSFLDKLTEMGAGYEVGNYGIRFYYKGKLRAVDVETQPYPGFMTDWQPIWAVLLTQAEGKSIIHETVSENRFQYVAGLREMGANMRMFNPKVSHAEKIYNFHYSNRDTKTMHALEITGISPLTSGEFFVPDLRAGATMVLAALIAQGTTRLTNVAHIDRGYEQLDHRLRTLGAQIVRA